MMAIFGRRREEVATLFDKLFALVLDALLHSQMQLVG